MTSPVQARGPVTVQGGASQVAPIAALQTNLATPVKTEQLTPPKPLNMTTPVVQQPGAYGGYGTPPQYAGMAQQGYAANMQQQQYAQQQYAYQQQQLAQQQAFQQQQFAQQQAFQQHAMQPRPPM